MMVMVICWETVCSRATTSIGAHTVLRGSIQRGMCGSSVGGQSQRDVELWGRRGVLYGGQGELRRVLDEELRSRGSSE